MTEQPSTQASDASVEELIQAKGLTAARITPADIEALMDRVDCIGSVIPDTTTTVVHAFLDERFYLGTTHSACVSPENFDEQIGLKIAREKMVALVKDKLWEMEGYRLYMSQQQEA